MSTNITTAERCYRAEKPDPPALIQNGKIVLQEHHIGFIISGAFSIIAIGVSFWLISKHLQWYTNKREQRYIVRLLFMVPLYAAISFASFIFWNQSTPIILVRDAYEAIVLTAFFYLLLMYISNDPEEQRIAFLKKGLSKEADRIAVHKGLPVSKWMLPIGFVKWKPKDGLYFLQLMKWGVLQYCVIRPATTLAAVVLDYIGLYCEDSWGLGWGHIYITIIVSISVSIAMYCLIQLYVPVSQELAHHKPLLKLFSVKAVVFLTFWQATLLGVLSMFGVVKDTTYMTADDINIGIGAILETFEMMMFAVLHIWAFTYKPYELLAVKAANGLPPTRTPLWRSLGHVFDFRETFREIWIGWKYLFHKLKGKEPKLDRGAKRIAHYEVAFGRSRVILGQGAQKSRKIEKGELETADATLPALEVEVDREVEVDVEGQRQWLGLGRNDRYGLHPGREKSEGLQEQIDHELERLGYPKLNHGRFPVPVDPKAVTHHSWWRNLYNRISQTGHEPEDEREGFIQRKSSKRRSRQEHLRTDTHLPEIDHNIDDRPPRSMLHPSRRPQPGSTAYYQDYDQDREDEHPMLPYNPNHGRQMRQNRYHDPFYATPTSPQSRSPPTSPRSHAGKLSRNVSPPQHPPRNQGDRNRRSSAAGGRDKPRSPRTSYIPPRDALVFPAPLSGVHHSPDFGGRQGQQTVGQYGSDSRPPPTPPKGPSRTALDSFPEEADGPYPIAHRNSTHRREPGFAPRSPDQDNQQRATSPMRAQQYSGLPMQTFPDDRTYQPQVMYIKQPTRHNYNPND